MVWLNIINEMSNTAIYRAYKRAHYESNVHFLGKIHLLIRLLQMVKILQNSLLMHHYTAETILPLLEGTLVLSTGLPLRNQVT